MGGGVAGVEELQRKEDRSDSLLGSTDSNVDQQHRTAFCAPKHARSGYKLSILMCSGFFIDASSGMSGCFFGG